MNVFRFLKNILKPGRTYEPLIEVRVFKDAILHNLRQYQSQYPNVKFAPVLKSNAYGHGAALVAKILDKEDVAFFMVDSFYEALVLRRAEVQSKILILGYATIEQINGSNLKETSFSIIDLAQLENIAKSLIRPTHFHLKIDTGMHRQGILPQDLRKALGLIKSNPMIILEGACSHFADADSADESTTRKQIEIWNQSVKELRSHFPQIKHLHASNTAGAAYLPEVDANVARLGLGLYGFDTSPRKAMNLQPAMEVVSVITSIKSIPQGEKVGYNGTYTAQRQTKVATVPVGYNEGLDPRLSNKGFVLVHGTACPIVGRISMNMCSIDITEAGEVNLEDEVVVLSHNAEDLNSVDSIAKTCGVSRYEVPVRIAQHLRRVIT